MFENGWRIGGVPVLDRGRSSRPAFLRALGSARDGRMRNRACKRRIDPFVEPRRHANRRRPVIAEPSAAVPPAARTRTATSEPRSSPLAVERPAYAPISAYGLVGDGRSCALIDTDGSLDWLCWPDFDSPSLFCAILDRRRGGRFRIGSAERPLRTHRRYVPETAVLETTFETPDGVLRLTDFMPVRDEERLAPLREIVRLVEAAPVAGALRFELLSEGRAGSPAHRGGRRGPGRPGRVGRAGGGTKVRVRRGR